MPSADLLLASRPSAVAAIRAGFSVGLGDLRHRYTWLSWSVGWLLRGSLEVTFFALIGVLLQRPDVVAFLIVGRGLFLGCLETLFVIQTVGWERQGGTLPLTLISPASVWAVFVGRAAQWLPSAAITPIIVILLLGPAFGVAVGPGAAAVLAAASIAAALGSFGFSLALASLVVRWPEARNLVANVAGNVLALLCGVFVPVSFWPEPVTALAQLVPLTHSIEAARGALDGADAGVATAASHAPQLGICLALGLAWFVVGSLLLGRHAEAGRRDGTVDLGD